MKWKAPSDRVQFLIASPIVLPIAAMALPIIGVMIGLTKLRAWLCPHRDWHE